MTLFAEMLLTLAMLQKCSELKTVEDNSEPPAQKLLRSSSGVRTTAHTVLEQKCIICSEKDKWKWSRKESKSFRDPLRTAQTKNAGNVKNMPRAAKS